MQAIEEHIKRINTKLQLLLKERRTLQKEVDRQGKIIAELGVTKLKDGKEIENLAQQVLLLKASSSQLNEADRNALDKHIGNYIKELDKCISLLAK